MNLILPVGKSQNLEYIARELPSKPINPLSKNPNGRFGKIKHIKKFAKKHGYPIIIRSDGPEDGLKKSFAGIFYSVVVNEESEIPDALNKVRYEIAGGIIDDPKVKFDLERTSKPLYEFKNDLLKKYCEHRNLNFPSFPINSFTQVYEKSDLNAIIMEHPNDKNNFIIDIEYQGKEFERVRTKHKYVIANLENIEKQIKSLELSEELSEETVNQVCKELTIGIKDYIEIEGLKAYQQSKISNQMEVTLLDYSINQFRPFRIKEYANFNVDDVAPKPNGEDIFEVPLVLGITGKEPIINFNLSIENRDYYSIKNVLKQTSELQKLQNNTSVIVGPFVDKLWGAAYNLEQLATPPALTIVENRLDGFQAHDNFRFLERGSLVGFVDLLKPLLQYNGMFSKYWSDGKKGIIQFTGSPE